MRVKQGSVCKVQGNTGSNKPQRLWRRGQSNTEWGGRLLCRRLNLSFLHPHIGSPEHHPAIIPELRARRQLGVPPGVTPPKPTEQKEIDVCFVGFLRKEIAMHLASLKFI